MAQASPMNAPADAPERSWMPIAGAIALAVVVGLALLGGYALVVRQLRHSRAGREVIAQVVTSPQLKQLLGEPLRVSIEGGELAHEGEASFVMQVRGPKGAASLEVEARAQKKVWHITRGKVALADGTEVPLEPGPGPSVAPAPAAPAPPASTPVGKGPQP